MFRPAGHHQVLLRLGDCCTSFLLLVAFTILKFYIYLVCHLLRIVYFLVSRVFALLPLCVCAPDDGRQAETCSARQGIL
jgi:hypothetical protein